MQVGSHGENLKEPLLPTAIQHDTDQTLADQKQALSVLTSLSDYHFSIKTLPLRWDCTKKYLGMLLSAGGGLGYWSAVDKYNKNHHLSDFEANSNIVCVILVTSLFLLQSVDLARNYLNQLAGSAPPELVEIMEITSAKQRRSIKLKTGLGSSISGLPFLIIALNDALPFITGNTSNAGIKTIIGLWALYFYLVNVGLHILPFALLQSSAFDYYLWPFTQIRRLFSLVMIDRELQYTQDNLQALFNEVRNLVAGRISNSLNHFFEKTATKIGKITDIFSEETNGLERLLFLLREYPPQPISPAPPRNFQRFLRLFGAQLELGGAFIWWTNIFPTLYNLFKKTGMNLTLAYSLTAILGLTPSYVLFVLLAFFGENQFPRLIHYVINAIKKLIGRPHTHSLLPPIAHARPVLFGIGLLAIGYISYFAPVNAKSLNEEQYQDTFSSTKMIILDIYANTGISIMSFISLLDFFSRYLIEVSAVFGKPQSPSQLHTRLLVTQENLRNDLVRISPRLLIAELKGLSDAELELLLGADKGRPWLSKHEEKIKIVESITHSTVDILPPNQNHIQTTPIVHHNRFSRLLSGCYTALFSISNCFSRCRGRSRTHGMTPILVRPTGSLPHPQ